MRSVATSLWRPARASAPSLLFASVLNPKRANDLLVLVICLTEVLQVVARQKGEAAALQAVDSMQQNSVIAPDRDIVIRADPAAIVFNLPLADSIVFVTARAFEKVVWMQDEDLDGLKGVRYFFKVK